MVHCLNNRFSLAKVVIFDNRIDRTNPRVQEHFSKVNQVDDRLNDRRIIVENYRSIHTTNHVVSNCKSEENLRSLFDQYPAEVVIDQSRDCTKQKFTR